MAQIVEAKVPDIGDFKDVPVIEVLVKVGDVVKAEDSLVTLESDKATMDVPSPVSGVVTELKVKVGDKVAEGFVLALVSSAAPEVGAGDTAVAAVTASPTAIAEQPAAPSAAAAPPPAQASVVAAAAVVNFRPGDVDQIPTPTRAKSCATSSRWIATGSRWRR